MNQAHIRNFAIIAHIDHGKSTLADRLMEMTGTVSSREMHAQLLDSNPIERERGITIKLAPVRMEYITAGAENLELGAQVRVQSTEYLDQSGSEYILNLIDTPGHVDFAYEVSRSLAACEGALLVVDATQGVQAQTLANLHQAKNNNLAIIPILNKIDMPHADIAKRLEELALLGFGEDEVIKISAKTGENVPAVLEAIVARIPPPKGIHDQPLRALVFSSQYDPHKGVVVFVRIVDGCLDAGSLLAGGQRGGIAQIRFLASGVEVNPIELGYFMPKMVTSSGLQTGEVGYIATGLKDIRVAKVGDTITNTTQSSDMRAQNSIPSSQFPVPGSQRPAPSSPHRVLRSVVQPLPGYKEPKPMVFLGLFPIDSNEFTFAREAMEKLRLSDSAFSFRPIASLALGNGFHCGFLGLLHAEVVQERLSREFDLSMLATAPSVEYLLKTKTVLPNTRMDQQGYYHIQSATEYPDPSIVEETKEPMMQLTIFTPKRYVGAVMQLASEKRAEYVDLKYFGDQSEFMYLIPLSEMIIDFFDRLKSVTEGYASLDYEFFEYQPVDVAKVDILVNKEKVDALSFLIVKDQAHRRGGEIAEKLAEVIPRQQFQVPIQAAIGGKIVARADVKAFRKDVIAKLYGGDRTRKDKLLKKQKKGKAKMKQVGSVDIPQDAFFKVLKRV